MRGLVHHVVLTVRNLEQSFRVYDSVLTALGYNLEQKDEAGFGWNLQTPSGSHSIHIGRASDDGAKRRHDRCSPGLHHLAWKVDSREEVDRIHQRLLGVGATILDPPAEYPQYNKGRGYYAVFFADPDGLKLECVYTPRSAG
jgi:catechol 2,3-dioxygenase-like lactoylglutathione lyase family enzyme